MGCGLDRLKYRRYVAWLEGAALAKPQQDGGVTLFKYGSHAKRRDRVNPLNVILEHFLLGKDDN